MARYQDLGRVIKGVSLVAKEAAEISSGLNMVRNGDIAGLISSTLKNIVNTATDLTGLTRGSIHQCSENKPNISRVNAPFTSEQGSKIEVQNDDTIKFSAQINFEHKDSPVSETFRAGSSSAREVAVVPEHPVADDNLKSLEEDVSANPTVESGEGVQVFANGNISETSSNKIQNVGESGSTAPPPPRKKRKPRERRVPSTPLGRALGFAGLGAGLAWGTFQESAKRLVFGKGDLPRGQSALSPFLSEQNAKRLALALCRMRGAALKLGQMLSIQDESLVPAPISAALEIVRQGADIMPRRQLNHVLDVELGSDWQSKLRSFDYEPMAAASIGQVHKAVTKDGIEVAVKIQYPGVADSIDSDIENVRRLLDYTNLIPQGLYLDQAMKVAKEELARECNYELEAANQKRFRNLLSGSEGFYVPLVIDEISCKRVLTTELVSGVPIDKVAQLNQETRNYVGRKLLELTLKELFVFRFMQTDPNWSNFLYDEASNTINLIDFGAAHMYSENFVDNYLRMVLACANRDEQTIIKMSQKLGFLTGLESQIMLDAHTQAAFVVGLPFSKAGGFDFGSTNLPKNISHLGATMLKHRLTPPPAEAYSLHRKLSGAFLACIKLQAVVPCREMLLDVYQSYNFSDTEDELDKTCSATA